MTRESTTRDLEVAEAPKGAGVPKPLADPVIGRGGSAADEIPVRVVTAAALFDGHDAAINVIRRVLQSRGAEVIHLGHDRSVDEVVAAALQEDADAIAVSSYQGGHMEYFEYLLERLRQDGAGSIRVYGGGGGVISPDEIRALHAAGVSRIFSPEDGQRLGLEGMIDCILAECRAQRSAREIDLPSVFQARPRAIARAISWFEAEAGNPGERVRLRQQLERHRTPRAPVIGFTGTGGAGKSSLVDEILLRFRREFPRARTGVLLVDPTRRRSGGALLGDRLRMNAIDPETVFVRSLATRSAHRSVSATLSDAVSVLQAAGFDWILVETAGIGQSDSEIVDCADVGVYVMTPEYGAASQLEKIDMLELADWVVINKSDRRGADDALRDVRKQWRRNHPEQTEPLEALPVFQTVANRWNDPGLDRFYRALVGPLLAALPEEAKATSGKDLEGEVSVPTEMSGLGRDGTAAPELATARAAPCVPPERIRYLAEISDTIRTYRERGVEQAERAGRAQAFAQVLESFGRAVSGAPMSPPGPQPQPVMRAARMTPGEDAVPAPMLATLRERYREAIDALHPDLRAQLCDWPATRARYAEPEQTYRVRGREHRARNHRESLSGLPIPTVALPRTESWRELARFFWLENLPGCFPFTAGVFPFKRTAEEAPTRMFAGEGPPERTNRRFHLLIEGQPAARLSTAFDSVTLYGRDPAERPDIWGKVGTSGVSVCTVDDAKKLYSGIDLLAPSTSVSMTINGPAPVVLAFFFNAAIDQAVEKHLAASGTLDGTLERYWAQFPDHERPRYAGDLPRGHDGLGLRLLGVAGADLVDPDTYARIRADVLRRVRGTVQADILKEDQAQNTCIFSTEFALRLMGDVQEYISRHRADFFYSVSISGYHIAEAGACPITQLAFTLANAFTYCEYFLSRGLDIDAFAPNLSFFFSNGLDPEYSVIGRVARRIWAVALRERYRGSERSQKLKYHVQTSGRSLHAQEMAFNDIRTTLQAWLALADHCNSLHTNAYDEAVTTPTEESVRRALAIQLILTREFGLLMNENPIQGAYLIDALTDQVEEAVLQEFERISDRGGVLGAMEHMYQRGKIQDESLRYESLKHSGELPIVGVNTFRNLRKPDVAIQTRELVRATEEERRAQLGELERFRARHAAARPAGLARLRARALRGENLFDELMESVQVASLGDIVDTLFEVGGRYRRAM